MTFFQFMAMRSPQRQQTQCLSDLTDLLIVCWQMNSDPLQQKTLANVSKLKSVLCEQSQWGTIEAKERLVQAT